MRFKTFLEQEMLDRPFTIKMPMQAAFEWIKEHCPIYAAGLQDDSAIYRGMTAKDPHDAQWGDSSMFRRTSANTHNYYTLMIDSAEKWEHYPPRSKSFICSTSEESASSYGKLFIAFPEDKNELGMCPRNDIWNSFRPKLEDLEIRSLKHFNRFIDEVANSPSEHDAMELRSDLQKITRDDLNVFDPGDSMKGPAIAVAAFMDKHHLDNLEELMDFVLDPDEAGFDIIKVSHFHDNMQYAREVWFSGKAVFIPSYWLLNRENEFNKLFTAEFGEF